MFPRDANYNKGKFRVFVNIFLIEFGALYNYIILYISYPYTIQSRRYVMRSVKIWFFVLAIFAGDALSGSNPNATMSLDFVSGNSNRVDDKVISGNVSGRGTSIFIEVFAKNITTELNDAQVNFDFDTRTLRLNRVLETSFPSVGSADIDGSGNNVGFRLYDGKGIGDTRLNSSGFLACFEFVTLRDVTNIPFEIRIKDRDSWVRYSGTDWIYDKGISVSFNASAQQQNIPRKNMIPGDINGDGFVNYADLVIFTDNFGRNDGDTFNPNNLIEASFASPNSPIVTITIRDTIERLVEVIVPSESLPKPNIHVIEGGWGTARISTLQTVFESSRDAIADNLMFPFNSDITVIHKEPEGPKILYNRRTDGDYEIWIDSENNRWSQQVFQFAHEYGHILSNYRDDYPNPQLWFDEAISMIASIYVLETLAESWRTDPPDGIRNYRIYAPNFKSYVDGIGDYLGVSKDFVSGVNLSRFYRDNKRSFESDYSGGNTRLQQYIVAMKLIDIFKDSPNIAWNAITYLNKGHVRVNNDFRDYLNDWRKRTPKQWQSAVDKIMSRFDINRATKIPVIVERYSDDTGPAGKDGNQ